tara:strand:- start:4272 stop:7844 length:3573 start_codon:yes stop_codon:yes gene_type:complete
MSFPNVNQTRNPSSKSIPSKTPLPTDKLKSIDFGTIVDCLGEGQIEGSATASKAEITDKTSTAYKNAFLKDLFLDNVAVLQADADNTNPDPSEFNYPEDRIRFEFQDGTANNKVLFAAEKQRIPISVNPLNNICTFPEGGTATARSVSIDDVRIDTVEVKIKFDQFFRIKNNGNRTSTSVQVIIKINPNNNTDPITIHDDTINGKSFNAYSRDYGIDLRGIKDANGNPLYNTNTSGESGSFFPVVISAERGNPTGDTNTFNTMRLDKVNAIIREPNNYPNIAYTALRFSSEIFQNAPRRIFRVRGKLVKIPNNVTVDSANGRIIYPNNYTFNGTFKTDKAWTSDPAWVLYDLLTDTRSGCAIPESELDPYTFYRVSTYCSALVDKNIENEDGNTDNEQEPRFSINVNINNRRDAMTLIKDICSVMRAIPYYEEGKIKIAQDAPKIHENPSAIIFDYVFNNANVVNGDFVYSGTSAKTRFNVINVSYFDLSTQEIDYETVKDTVAQANYGTQIKTINTFGTTSRGQAQRVGRWFLQTQQNQVESVVFDTNIAAGSIVSIGDIIGIADRVKASTRRGGLVKAVSSSQDDSNIDLITLDNAGATNLPDTSDNAKISCMLSNGTVETKTIVDYVTGNVVKISGNFTSAPVLNSPFILESGEVPVQAFKVVSIKENKNKTYTITGINFNESKYAAVEDGTPLTFKNFNLTTSILPSPQITEDIENRKAIEETIVINNNRPVPKLFIDWQSVDGASGYEVVYIKDDENPVVEVTQESSLEILPSEAGTYKIQIYTLNSSGERSATPTERIVDVIGLTAEPETPTGFEIEPINNSQVRLRWTKTTSLDVEFGGLCVIRHTPNTLSSASFANSTVLNENINGSTNEAILPALSGTYSLKFRDLGGRLSTTEAKVELALPEMEDQLQLKNSSGNDFRENPSFGGNKPNNHVVIDAGTLRLNNPATSLTGSYEFSSVLDFEAVYQNIRIVRHLKTEGFLVSDDFDSIPDLDLRDNFDGEGSDRLTSNLQVQTSQDNSSFTTPANVINGSFNARAFKFTANLTSVDVNENIKFTELGFDAFLPSRTENKYIDSSTGNVKSSPISSTNSANGFDVVFANRFFTGTSDIGGSTTEFLPSINITPFNLPSGAYFIIKEDVDGNFLNAANQNVNGTGFNIIFKNSSNTPINVKFSFQALGYGKGA